MSDFLKASEIFDSSFSKGDYSNASFYFESIAAEFTKNSLLKSVNAKDIPLMFLLGEPGVGKTHMLNVIQQSLAPNKKILFSSEPFRTPESFLHFLLKDESFNRDLSLPELKEEAIRRFNGVDNLIIIDEAQLLDTIILEFIRILSDSNQFNFLLCMHKDEGEAILSKNHFASRNHTVVTLDLLTKNEINKYIESQLLRHGLGNISEIFKSKAIKQLQTLSKGNFRVLKQLLKHTFSIMDYARSNGHKKYITPNNCVITMAGIDLGIIKERYLYV